MKVFLRFNKEEYQLSYSTIESAVPRNPPAVLGSCSNPLPCKKLNKLLPRGQKHKFSERLNVQTPKFCRNLETKESLLEARFVA